MAFNRRQSRGDRGGHTANFPPEAAEHKIGRQQNRAAREQRREGVRHAPTLPQHAHPPRVPVGVQRRLREQKSMYGFSAGGHQLRSSR